MPPPIARPPRANAGVGVAPVGRVSTVAPPIAPAGLAPPVAPQVALVGPGIAPAPPVAPIAPVGPGLARPAPPVAPIPALVGLAPPVALQIAPVGQVPPAAPQIAPLGPGPPVAPIFAPLGPVPPAAPNFAPAGPAPPAAPTFAPAGPAPPAAHPGLGGPGLPAAPFFAPGGTPGYYGHPFGYPGFFGGNPHFGGPGGHPGPGGPPGPGGITPGFYPAINPAVTSYVTDPYYGNINPGTKEGQALFIAATKDFPAEKQLKITQSNARFIVDQFKQLSQSFGWGVLINVIMNAKGEPCSLLQDFRNLTLEDVQWQARTIWEDDSSTGPLPKVFTTRAIDPANVQTDRDIFFQRVRSRMISKCLLKYIDPASKKSLETKKKQYEWLDQASGRVELDGPTMLKIILDKINPSTQVGVMDLKLQLRKCKLSDFGNDVDVMTTHMVGLRDEIVQDGHSHPDMEMDVLASLLTSTNKEFKMFVEQIKGNWEVGKDYSYDTIIDEVVTKFNNLKKGNVWGQVDPLEQKIIALTTMVTNIGSTSHALTTGTNSTDSNKNPRGKGKANIEPWRFIKTADKVVKDGKEWWFCMEHKGPDYNGMYVRHPPEKHAEWLANKLERQTKRKPDAPPAPDSTTSSAPNQGSKRLVMADRLKAALTTDFCMTEDQIEDLISKSQEN